MKIFINSLELDILLLKSFLFFEHFQTLRIDRCIEILTKCEKLTIIDYSTKIKVGYKSIKVLRDTQFLNKPHI